MSKMKYEFQEEMVSIVTPVYNGEFHLTRMLDSILNQTYEKMEMILVDDEFVASCCRKRICL